MAILMSEPVGYRPRPGMEIDQPQSGAGYEASIQRWMSRIRAMSPEEYEFMIKQISGRKKYAGAL